MTINRYKLGWFIGAAAFVLQFPCYYLYFLLGSWGIGYPLQGYSVRMAAICLPFLATGYFLSQIWKESTRQFDLIFIGFLAFISLWATAFGMNSNIETVQIYIGSSVVWLSFYMNARLIFSGPPSWKLTSASHAALIVIIIANTEGGAFSLPAISDQATYQGFAVVYLITALCATGSSKTHLGRWGNLIPALPMLFLINARSELIALVVVMATYIILDRKKPALTLAIVAAISLLIISNFEKIIGLSGGRIADLFLNRAAGSLSERSYALSNAIDVIKNNPLTGNFAAYPPGYYAHNAISVWADFGIPGVVFFTTLISLAFRIIIKRHKESHHGEFGIMVTASFIALIILLIFSKAFTYYLTPFVLGLVSAKAWSKTEQRK